MPEASLFYINIIMFILESTGHPHKGCNYICGFDTINCVVSTCVAQNVQDVNAISSIRIKLYAFV